MMTRREMSAALTASLVGFLSEIGAPLRADAGVSRQSSQESTPLAAPRGIPSLMQESIGDVGDAEASMLILNIPASSPPGPHRAFRMHKHSGPVFAYVIEGSVENQVDPDQPKTYNAGDYWYEPAMHVHRLLRNLSDTQQARILVFEVLPKGKPPAYSVK